MATRGNRTYRQSLENQRSISGYLAQHHLPDTVSSPISHSCADGAKAEHGKGMSAPGTLFSSEGASPLHLENSIASASI